MNCSYVQHEFIIPNEKMLTSKVETGSGMVIHFASKHPFNKRDFNARDEDAWDTK